MRYYHNFKHNSNDKKSTMVLVLLIKMIIATKVLGPPINNFFVSFFNRILDFQNLLIGKPTPIMCQRDMTVFGQNKFAEVAFSPFSDMDMNTMMHILGAKKYGITHHTE